MSTADKNFISSLNTPKSLDNWIKSKREAQDRIIKPIKIISHSVSAGLVNLTSDSSRRVLFASSHYPVIQNIDKSEQQTILEGHVGPITCITSSEDKKWIASGDTGPQNAVIVWDSRICRPVKTIFDPHPNGVVALSFTSDGRYLATLSSDGLQEIKIWDWTTECSEPLCSIIFNEKKDCRQNCLSFKPFDNNYFITNNDRYVYFHSWDTLGNSEFFIGVPSNDVVKQSLGKINSSVFIPQMNMALSCTSTGYLMNWKASKKGKGVIHEFKKYIQIHKHSVTALTTVKYGEGTYLIVTGDAIGNIKFHKTDFTVLYIYNNPDYGAINAISFAAVQKIESNLFSTDEARYPPSFTVPGEDFVAPDFMASTDNGIFFSQTVKGIVKEIIKKDDFQRITEIATHPKLPIVTAIGYSGTLKSWNYYTGNSLKYIKFEERPTTISYCNKEGVYLAIGFQTGKLRVFNSTFYQDQEFIDYSLFDKNAIHKMKFSSDDMILAYADENFTVTTLIFSCEDKKYMFGGRFKSHMANILDMLFIKDESSSKERLFTLGADRRLVEYDLSKSQDEKLLGISKVQCIDRVNDICCMCYMPLDLYPEGFLCIGNCRNKFVFHNSLTFLARQTRTMSITTGRFRKIITIEQKEKDEYYVPNMRVLSVISDDKLALAMLPLTGNPNEMTYTLANMAPCTGLALSICGRFIFTSGGGDNSLHMWSIRYDLLEKKKMLGGEGMLPFYSIISEPLLHEMKDFFYFSMLRSETFNILNKRVTTRRIANDEVPHIMRAIGVYSSEQDINRMLDELKLENFYHTGIEEHTLDLDRFIHLYVNYRNAGEEEYQERVDTAFEMIRKKLGSYENSLFEEVDTSELIKLLLTRGEAMSEQQLAEDLSVLLGLSCGANKAEFVDSHEELNDLDLDKLPLPDKLTIDDVYSKLLLMQMAEMGSDNESINQTQDTATATSNIT